MRAPMRFSSSWRECGSSLVFKMETFYNLQCVDSNFVELAEGNNWEGIVCPENAGHRRAGKRTTILRVDIVSGRVVDFSSTILPYVVLTERARCVIQTANLSGFRIEPVQVCGKPKGMALESVPKLWELVVTGDGGFSHPNSGVKLKHDCQACGLVRYSAFEHGIVVDEIAYDGSDFFVVKEYPAYVLVNEKAKSAIESAGLTGINFVESTRLHWPEGVVKP